VNSIPAWGWVLAVGAGGLGALLRTALVRGFVRYEFPAGVLVANTVASAVGGATVGWSHHLDHVWVVVIVGGLCGGLSVVSTLVADAIELWMAGRRRLAGRTLIANVACGLGAAWAAYALVS
jgi:CrcB protein